MALAAGSQAGSTVQADPSVLPANNGAESAATVQEAEPRTTIKRQASEEPAQSTSEDIASRPTAKKAKQGSLLGRNGLVEKS